MSNILIILFSILDCNVWSIDKLISWSDNLFEKLEHPKTWLADLSVSNSVDDCLKVIREAMKKSGVMLPDNIGDLMAGLILLRYDNGDISADDTRNYLVDVIDAYGASCVDAEAAGQLDLNYTGYSEIRKIAEESMKYLCSGQLTETDRKLAEE